MVLVLAAPTLPAASVSSGSRPPPPSSFDFSDESYRQQGLDPEKIRSRISPDSGLAVLNPCPDPARRGVRALEVRGGYDAAGCPVYFHRFGALDAEGFAPGPAGQKARAIAQEFRVFRFPSRKASAPTLLRQDPVFDTSPGSLGRNPLGLWQVTTVVFTEKVFRSQIGLAAMEEIRKRNGTDLDGTPLLKHLSEIQLLEREGYVRLDPGSPRESTSPSWMIAPLLEDPLRDGFADDAFLALVIMDEGSPVDPLIEQTFLCLTHSGITGASRMPRLPPFVQALPIPPDLRPRERSESAGTPPVSVFELHERPFQHRFHPDLPPGTLWGYEGMFPGPTLRVRRGEPSLLRVRNELPPQGGGGIGQPRTACRVGLSDSPGTPEDHFGPGQSKDYPIAALRPPGSGRYRDGRLGFGAQNAYKGLAGFMISTDPVDSGDENDPDPRALRLPAGPCDVPLLLADRRFGVTLDHPLSWDPFSMTGCPDDYVTVNGAVQPYFKVARRKYRFRIWNAGPSRAYELSLSNRSPLILLGVDGSLLEAPVDRTGLRLPADQLQDVVIDFSRAPLGTEVYLENQTIPGPVRVNPLPEIPRPPLRILKFLVDRDAPDPSRIPPQLGPGRREAVLPELPTRTFAFADDRGVWTLNGKTFDLDRADAAGKPGAREIWVLKNGSKDQTLSLRLTAEGRLPGAPALPPWESGPRSVTELRPGEEARLLFRFPEGIGRYVFGSGDSVQEDRGFLFRWDVKP
jgi:FtsP/CotA-like multicopper oxidase with cupredoxin domain